MRDTNQIPTRSTVPLKKAVGAIAAVFGVVLAVTSYSRIQAREQLHQQASEGQVPTVNVIKPSAPSATTLVLPGRVEAWSQVAIRAQTTGYLRRWLVDIGQPVSKGELLAEIDTPEVSQQLSAARAALDTANAHRDLAKSTDERWGRLLAQNAVSRQDAEERRGDLGAREAMRSEAAANVERLETQLSFNRVVAPFSGVVTARATDVGSLVVSGSSAPPLFTVSDVSQLRIYVKVPEAYVARVHPGLVAHFNVPYRANETFDAKLVRSAEAVDPASGTMLVQLICDNKDGLLKPGAYAKVTFDFPVGDKQASANVRIPASSLLFRREGPAVALVDAQGKVSVQAVKVRSDQGAELEVTGLKLQDSVIDNPPDDIRANDMVKAVPAKKVGHA